MEDDNRYREVRRTLILVLVANLFVAFLKAIFGVLSNSLSMIADSIHSFFDSSSNIIGLIAMGISRKPPDDGHPYGHRKAETFATLVIALMLLLTGFEIIENALRRIREQTTPDITAVTFSVMLLTLAVNWIVSRYECRRGKNLRNTLLVADSMHTRSDIYASLSVIAGFAMVKSGYPIADPLIALLIVLIILRTGMGIIKGTSSTLMDSAILDPESVVRTVKSVEGVQSCHRVRSRGTAGETYMDLHLLCKPDIPLEKAHEISHEVEEKLKKKFKSLKDVIIHTEPDED